MSFILFPTRLFELQYIPKKFRNFKFYLIEHDRFYGIIDKMNFNKKKIILHKASCLAYIDEMKDKIDIKHTSKYPTIRNSEIYMFDAIDNFLENEVTKFYEKIKTKVHIFGTPNFMTSKMDLQIYYNKYKKNKNNLKFIHSTFYKFQLELHNIPHIKKSYDTENRNAITKKENMPKENKNIYIKQAIKFTENKFKKNYGNSNYFYIPVTHSEAKKWFNAFLNNKAKKFAEYQDSIVPKEPFLFHSVISAVMNIGLLNPKYIIDKVINAYKDKKMDIKDYANLSVQETVNKMNTECVGGTNKKSAYVPQIPQFENKEEIKI